MTSRLLSMFEHAMPALFRASWQACVLAGIVLLIQRLLGARLSARARYVLWAVVVVRLLLPVVPQSSISVFNLARVTAGGMGRQSEWIARAPIDPQREVAAAPSNDRAKPQAAAMAHSRGIAPVAPTRLGAHAIIGVIWVVGVFVLSLRVLRACLNLSRLRKRLKLVDDPNIMRLVESSAELVNLRRRPVVLAGDCLHTPAVVGVLHPALLLPAQVLRDFDSSELRLIVLHELAHLKRHDVAGNWVLCIATIVHWFNPLVWLIAWRVRGDRELACDELVLSCSKGRDAQAYGQTLLKLIEHLSPRASSRQLVGIVESSGPIKRRVRMIARFNPRSSRGWVWGLCLLLVLGCTTLTDAVSADEKAPAAAGAGPAPFAPAVPGDPAQGEALRPAGDAELQAALQRVVPEARFDGIAFGDVIDYLRDVCKVNLVVEWRALESAGIDSSAPVTMRLNRVTLESLLEHMLKDVGGGSVLLDYMIDRGAIVISTQDNLAGRTKLVLYDVTDLMHGPDGKPLAGPDELAKKMKSLMEVIQEFVASGSWRDNGGNIGSIAEFNGKLLVTTTPKYHTQIEWLLDKLRENPTTVPALAEK